MLPTNNIEFKTEVVHRLQVVITRAVHNDPIVKHIITAFIQIIQSSAIKEKLLYFNCVSGGWWKVR